MIILFYILSFIGGVASALIVQRLISHHKISAKSKVQTAYLDILNY